ncbi:ATP-binding protein [Pelagicoccus sp. SDUM812003]|uniref:sensor histidine kinase n=1 Tax=Pelagicoccus sp. SDUM812003 TaxID=3041267 RepID=UPI00280FC209|nr:ATP-binding protein [Pelagicoccus sp. SDUM812003]MDQ8203425.1 ATP-binding protein [Pelagicoccus sp. SDUM812003]
MSQPDDHQTNPSASSTTSEDSSTAETLFLLSICRDDDDAAALRADLRRSSLQRYKLQHCAHIDDANHLLQVCGFDVVFLRLDDFQDKQGAIDLVRESDPHLSLIALATSRLLAGNDFRIPAGIDATCRIEDLSPTLISNLVQSVTERKRSAKERARLAQERDLAIEAGELGSWSLDVETGRIELSENAQKQLRLPAYGRRPCYLDDILEFSHPDDQDRFKRTIDLSIETRGSLRTNLRIARNDGSVDRFEISARYQPGGPSTHPKLFGYLRKASQSPEDLQNRIESANAAIQKALALRDEAIAAAGNELQLLLDRLNLIEGAEPQSTSTTKSLQQAAPPGKASFSKPAEPAISDEVQESVSSASGASATASEKEHSSDNASLGLDKQSAFRSVLKSITRQKQDQSANTFPFDFSSSSQADYSEPNPDTEGFVGAAKRLVSITQNGHKLRVNLSIDNDGAIETERERELLYEILKELLTNVVKHARASECIIAIFRDEDDWVLQVEDDGVGLEKNLISISTPLNQIGLFRIRTKLALKGGQLDLTPTQPKGLIARARLPVNLASRGAERA